MTSAKLTKVVFNLGMFAGASLVAFAGASIVFPGVRQVLSIQVMFGYDIAACVHVAVLAVLAKRAAREAPPERFASILYTCGFIHTLLAIGLALIGTTAILLSRNTIDPRDTLLVVAPLGAAVLPHAIAVWQGLSVEQLGATSTSGQDAFFRALADEATLATASIAELYRQRASAAEAEIAQIDAITQRLGDLGDAAETALTDASTAID